MARQVLLEASVPSRTNSLSHHCRMTKLHMALLYGVAQTITSEDTKFTVYSGVFTVQRTWPHASNAYWRMEIKARTLETMRLYD